MTLEELQATNAATLKTLREQGTAVDPLQHPYFGYYTVDLFECPSFVMFTNLGLSVGLIVFGPSVWVQVLGNATPIIPLSQPAIISAPAAFLVMIVVSLLTREPDRTPASQPA